MKYTRALSYVSSRRCIKPGYTLSLMGDTSRATRVANNQNGGESANRTATDIIAKYGPGGHAYFLTKMVISGSTRHKAFWTVLVIVCFLATSLQLALLLWKYLQFPVVELSEIRHGLPVEYPSVTVCNLQPISINKMESLLTNGSETISRWLQFLGMYKLRERSVTSRGALYENLGEAAEDVSHSLQDMLIQCRFNRETCSVQNFTSFFDGNYFNCFTFNDGRLGDPLKAHATGPENGLSLVISVGKYLPSVAPALDQLYDIESNIDHSAGIRVVVHAPGSMPSPVDHGFDIPPGYSSSVGLKAVLHTRLSQPYGNCTEGTLEGMQTYRNTFFACLQLCKQRLIIERCKCKSSALPEVPANNVTFCGSITDWPDILTNVSGLYGIGDFIPTPGLECEEREQGKLNNDRAYETDCGCYQPCSETTYLKSVSLAYWPRTTLKTTNPTWRATHISTEDAQRPGDETAKEEEPGGKVREVSSARRHLLRLNIYMEDLSVVEYRQLPAYGLVDLFADIGGTMGLWMGISVLTIVELCELVYRLLLASRPRRTREARPATSVPAGALPARTLPARTLPARRPSGSPTLSAAASRQFKSPSLTIVASGKFEEGLCDICGVYHGGQCLSSSLRASLRSSGIVLEEWAPGGGGGGGGWGLRSRGPSVRGLDMSPSSFQTSPSDQHILRYTGSRV